MKRAGTDITNDHILSATRAMEIDLGVLNTSRELAIAAKMGASTDEMTAPATKRCEPSHIWVSVHLTARTIRGATSGIFKMILPTDIVSTIRSANANIVCVMNKLFAMSAFLSLCRTLSNCSRCRLMCGKENKYAMHPDIAMPAVYNG